VISLPVRARRNIRPVDAGLIKTKGRGWSFSGRFNPKTTNGRKLARGFIVTDKTVEARLLKKRRRVIGLVGPKGTRFKVFRERRKD
jgi:hypothetical protein